jgi:hypothetical protein
VDDVTFRAHLDLARAYRDMGMVEDAVETLALALAARPHDEDALRLRDDLRGSRTRGSSS